MREDNYIHYIDVETLTDRKVWPSAVQYGTVQLSTVEYNTAQYSAAIRTK